MMATKPSLQGCSSGSRTTTKQNKEVLVSVLITTKSGRHYHAYLAGQQPRLSEQPPVDLDDLPADAGAHLVGGAVGALHRAEHRVLLHLLCTLRK